MLHKPRTIAVLALLALAANGCGSIGSYCDDRTECEGGADSDLEACEIVFTARSDRADLEGCTEQFDTYLDCLSDESTCNEDDSYVPAEECTALDEALSTCEQQ